MDYWKECIQEAFESAGLTATPEQVDEVASWAEGAHDNYSQALGHDVVAANYQGEKDAKIEALQRSLEAEKDKVHCRECDGRGRIIENFGSHSSNTECWKCRGEGRVSP